jgi:hypothetical protein
MMAKKPPDDSYDLVPPEAPKSQEKAAPPKAVRTELGQERTCHYCGFSFHGPPKARCPDCAAPMDSGTTDQLKFSDPAWVRRVAMGLVLMIPGIAGHIVAAFFRWSITNDERRTTIHLFSAAFLVVAVFVSTWKEPGTKRGMLTLWARIMVLAALGFWIGLFMVFRREDFNMQIVRALICPALICHVALAAMMGIYCGELAMRIPDDGLSWHAIHGGWVVAAANGLLLVLHFLQLTTPVHFMFFTCSFPMIGGLLVIFFWAMVTLLRLALNLRLCAKAGDEIVALRTQRMAAREKK